MGVGLVWVALADARCLPARAVGVERSVSVSNGLSGVGWHVWAGSGRKWLRSPSRPLNGCVRVCGLVWGAGFAPGGGRANRAKKREEKREMREKRERKKVT